MGTFSSKVSEVGGSENTFGTFVAVFLPVFEVHTLILASVIIALAVL